MRVQTASFATLGLALVALLCACARQGQGEPCNTQGNDCQSSLTCVPIPGSTDLGTCCMPNTQCSNAQSGFPLHQNDNTGAPEAATDNADAASSDAAMGNSDATMGNSDAAMGNSDATTGSSDAATDTANNSHEDAGDADARQGADASPDAGGGG
jgi:hypothetical protein